MKNISICIASEKGGVGKTVLSYALSKDLKFDYITNDLSENLNTHGKYMKKIIKKEDSSVVYDLGGFSDKNASELIFSSNLLIIPTIPDVNSIMKSIIMARKYKGKIPIILLANRIKDKKDKEKMKKIHSEFVDWTELVFLKETKIFQNAYEKKSSPLEIYNKNKLNKHVFKTAIKSYSKILNRVEGVCA